MPETFACEKWVDGSWWQATIPDGWRWKRDQSIRGWPYVCTCQDARLIIHHHFSGGETHGGDWSIVPTSIQDTLERNIYFDAIGQLARISSRRYGHGPSDGTLQNALVRHAFPELTGYSYEFEEEGKCAWRGHFAYERWYLRTILLCEESAFDDVLQASLAILSSIRFYERSPG